MTPPRINWRQAGLITLAAAALLAGLHWIPAGPRLSHMDFVPGGQDALQFCDPNNPRLLPVVTRRSSVVMTLFPSSARAGSSVDAILSIATATQKPIGPADLLPTAGQSLHLLVAGPEGDDFQAPLPSALPRPGDWAFTFRPRRGGLYRIFADFTPAATRREMYGSADMPVQSGQPSPPAPPPSRTADIGGYRFVLQPAAKPIYARQPVDLILTIIRVGGGTVPLQPFLGALAHLVAFDENRTGFVHLHALPPIGGSRTDPACPALVFKVTFDDPGRYTIWSRANLAGREIDAPFRLEVLP
jgi:hypothetical protein